MSAGYRLVSWTPFKKQLDLWMIGVSALYLLVFVIVAAASQPEGNSIAPVQVAIRATGSLAFLLLTGILCIGPLARIDRRFLPFLYNRRHMGVTTFLVALVHAALVLMWYHGFADLNPLVSLIVSNPRYDSIAGFPFEALGLIAFIILFLMAATSHDFWNALLGAGLWKALHMAVYAAYALLTAHIALGVIQSEKSPLYLILLAGSVAVVTALHLVSALRFLPATSLDDGYLDAGPASAIPDGQAVIVSPPAGERIAVFRSGAKLWAISNVCRHQGGPLGEGRLVDGCVTCPWHGFQYDPETGCAPPPFTEKIATYATRIQDGHLMVSAEPAPLGTPSPPSLMEQTA